jgi:hypothetical protein
VGDEREEKGWGVRFELIEEVRHDLRHWDLVLEHRSNVAYTGLLAGRIGRGGGGGEGEGGGRRGFVEVGVFELLASVFGAELDHWADKVYETTRERERSISPPSDFN